MWKLADDDDGLALSLVDNLLVVGRNRNAVLLTLSLAGYSLDLGRMPPTRKGMRLKKSRHFNLFMFQLHAR